MHGFIQRVHQNHAPAAEKPGHEFRKTLSPRRAGHIALPQILQQPGARLTFRQGCFQLVKRRGNLRRVPDFAHGRAWRRTVPGITKRDQIVLFVEGCSLRDLFQVMVFRRQPKHRDTRKALLRKRLRQPHGRECLVERECRTGKQPHLLTRHNGKGSRFAQPLDVRQGRLRTAKSPILPRQDLGNLTARKREICSFERRRPDSFGDRTVSRYKTG